METSREGVLVDIGSKSEGIIPLNEMHSLGADPLSKVKRGDELLVYVLQPESQEGQVILSIDRARGEQGWRTLQKRHDDQESFEGEVTGFNKGGLLVNVEGVNAFVPLSQVVGARPDREDGEGGLQGQVGRKLRLKVIEINRRRNRVILSERAAMQEYRSQQKDRLLSELREGEIRRGRITSVRPFGVFVDLGGADGLAHLSELTWERGRTPEEVYKVGDEVDVYVMKVDPETKKIALSLRRAQPERWDEIVDEYRIGQIVPARVTKLVTFGAFARVDGPVEGLIHVSELSDRRINHPRDVVREGDIVPLKVLRIERDKHRIALSLRQAREDAERQGWEFDANGTPISFPEAIRTEIESRLGASPERIPDREDQPEYAPREEAPARPAPRAAAPPPAPAPVSPPSPPDDEPVSAFEALRGFRSEVDERRAAEEAAARAGVTAEPAETNAAVETEAASESAPGADAEPEAQAEVESEALAGSEPETELGSQTDGEAEAQAEIDAESEALIEAASEPEGTITAGGPEAEEAVDADVERMMPPGTAEDAESVAAGEDEPEGTIDAPPQPPPASNSTRPDSTPRGEEKAESST
jgi:small subunit ribosomal protein S1